MGKYDKQIKEANKIADGWLKTSQEAEEFFIRIKKEQVKWEKDEIKRIEGLVNAKDPAAQGRIEQTRIWLADYRKECEKTYKEHGSFVRGEPRRGSAGICEKLKLKPQDDAYKAVMDAMKKVLISHTKQFMTTENAWSKDLEPRLDLLESKLDTLEKLARGAEGQMDAYGKQLARDLKKYKSDMESAVSALKADQIEKNIKDMTSDREGFLGGLEKARRDAYQLWTDRIAIADRLKELAVKNYKRILKSIPQDVRDKPMFARALKMLELALKEAAKALNEVQGRFKTAKATFEKIYPELV
ncbi:hypothetical protein LNKW23_31930 [Paralimibaculum aggregatum]|uniref:DUF349 domain-containing protein n=1 Tax=Paralimibaculum aggregatum TaxID=3036245 RepID=A0ABQ6LNT9_9RHOB|nr:hypothetical protein [Limibaculum sp. NKW23]GMG83979.1 hypothetical protein LNKW23_31930 [Limibaculum sp. NKW23]